MIGSMKTTLEVPDSILRQARVLAAARGVTLERLLTEALEEKLRRAARAAARSGRKPPWMAGFGALSHLSAETRRIEGLIEQEFERIEPEDAV